MNISIHGVEVIKHSTIKRLVNQDGEPFYTLDLEILSKGGKTDTLTLFSENALDLELMEYLRG